MKQVGVTQFKREIARWLRCAQKEPIVLTRRGRPVAVVIGVEGKDFGRAMRSEGSYAKWGTLLGFGKNIEEMTQEEILKEFEGATEHGHQGASRRLAAARRSRQCTSRMP